MLKSVRYAVLILNYNTIDDAIRASHSVIENAENDNYVICIADNASSNQNDRDKLASLSESKIITTQLSSNGGYAKGNNDAIKYVLKTYDPKYIVVMNPDVFLIEKGTIEKLIERIENEGYPVIGGQPLVWNFHYGNDPRIQQNIRKVQNAFDVCLTSFYPLRFIFSKRYKDITFLDKIPYEKEIRYHVPSGAFFVIQKDVFEKIGMFDENTFLYYEEHILGYKLKSHGYMMLFVPSLVVKHEHGKSTGFSRLSVSKYGMKATLDSKLYYLNEYLKKGRMTSLTVKVLTYMDFFLKSAIKKIGN